MPTASQIAQVEQASFSMGLLEIVQTYSPLFNALDFRTNTDETFLSLALTKLAEAAVFADYGEGFSGGEAEFELREFAASLIGGRIEVEMITEEKWNRKRGKDMPEFFDLQLETKGKNTILSVEKQMVRGRTFGGNVKGFSGFRDMTPFSGGVFTIAETPDEYSYERSVLNVGGTTSDTGTSVYSLVSGPMDVQGVLCGKGSEDGEIIRPRSPIRIESKNGTNGLPLDHKVQQWDGLIGLSMGGMNQQIEGQVVPVQSSIRRAGNITKEVGKTCTDDVIEALVESHGEGKSPDILVMTQRSQKQLADSRTAVRVFNMGPGDARNNTPPVKVGRPTDWEGITIVVPQTSVLSNNEAIEA